MGRATGWDIQGLIDDKDQFQKPHQELNMQSQGRPILQGFCSRAELDQEVAWIETTLTTILDTYSKVMRVTSYSKRWWSREVAEAQKIWAKVKKKWGHTSPNIEKLKKAQNAFYHLIHKVKRECWQNFLEGKEETLDPGKTRPKDQNRCWIALKYTKPKTNSTTPMLIELNNERAVTVKAKETVVRAHAFPPPPIVYGVEYQPSQGFAHSSITKTIVGKAFFCQLVKKAPGPNMDNFQILCILWGWDLDCIISIATQVIRLQYHPD